MKRYRLVRQTNYLMKDGPGFVQYIVEKRGRPRMDARLPGPRRAEGDRALRFLDRKVVEAGEVRDEDEAAYGHREPQPYTDLGGMIVTERARNSGLFKKAIHRAMMETAGRKNP